jgi:hypothetical protein
MFAEILDYRGNRGMEIEIKDEGRLQIEIKDDGGK